MGLSSKQVSSGDGYGWSQSLLQAQLPYICSSSSSSSTIITTSSTSSRILKRPASVENEQQQQLAEAVKCPRCDSANTKFCYYNNYNKLQPRHFCKACKRHWTEGGTLRNVPVGGARKNSLKTTKSNSSTTPSATANTSTTAVRNQQVAVPFSIGAQPPIHPTSFSLLFETDRGDSIGGVTNNNTGTCFTRSTSVSDDHLPVPSADQSLQSTKVMSPTPHSYNHGISTSSGSSFNTTPSSISTSFFGSKQISNGIGYSGDHSSPVKEQQQQQTRSSLAPWEIAADSTTTLMDNEIMTTTSSYWNYWEDIDTFVSAWDHIDSDPIKQL